MWTSCLFDVEIEKVSWLLDSKSGFRIVWGASHVTTIQLSLLDGICCHGREHAQKEPARSNQIKFIYIAF